MACLIIVCCIAGANALTDNLLLAQQSWLLKALAIELRLTSANRQRSHTQRLMNVLLDDTPTISEKGEHNITVLLHND